MRLEAGLLNCLSLLKHGITAMTRGITIWGQWQLVLIDIH